MGNRSLEDALRAAENPVEMLRSAGGHWTRPREASPEYTNRIEETAACHETCVPVDLGYDHVISFDHDFVGREALERELEDPKRTRVTLVWDSGDFVETYATLFEEESPNKFVDLPRDRWGAQYDEVLVEDELVGF